MYRRFLFRSKSVFCQCLYISINYEINFISLNFNNCYNYGL